MGGEKRKAEKARFSSPTSSPPLHPTHLLLSSTAPSPHPHVILILYLHFGSGDPLKVSGALKMFNESVKFPLYLKT